MSEHQLDETAAPPTMHHKTPLLINEDELNIQPPKKGPLSLLLSWHTLLLLIHTAVFAVQQLMYKKLSEMMSNYTMMLVLLQPLLLLPIYILWQVGRALRGFWRPPDLRMSTMGIYVGQALLVAVFTAGERYGSRGDLVSGPLGLILRSGTTPTVMLLGRLFLGRTFAWTHLLGALLVVGAVPVSLVPSFELGFSRSSASAVVVLLLSVIPLAGVQVWNEYLLQTKRVEKEWLLIFLCLFHVIICVPMFLLAPLFQPGDVGWNFDDIWANARNGFACFFTGQNFAANDECTWAWAWFVSYTVALSSLGVLALFLTKIISAPAVAFSQSVALPIVSLLFILPVFGGFPFSPWLIPSIAMVMVGMVLYRLKKEGIDGKPLCKCGRNIDDRPVIVEEKEVDDEGE